MTFQRFCKIVLTLKKQDEVLNDLYKMKVDIIDFVDPYQGLIAELMKEVYGEEGYDWFSWFCYESEYGHKNWNSGVPRYKRNEDGTMERLPDTEETVYGAKDKNGNPICYDIKSTWEYLENLRNNGSV